MRNFEQYMFGKEFHAKVQDLKKRGGVFQKAAVEAMELVMKINAKHPEPFGHLNVTHHGESRIKHCVKYDLPGAVRLITIQDNGVCLLAYIGDHEESDSWLETRKGINLTIDKRNKALVPVRISEDIYEPEKRINSVSDYSEGLLYRKLKDFYFKKVAGSIAYTELSPFLAFDSTLDDDDLLNACQNLPQYPLQSVFFDVFHFLRSGDIDQAQNRILEFEDELKLVSKASEAEVQSIQSNDQYVNIRELEAEFLQGILHSKGWYEWMAFLHPDQKKVVNADFKGSARLLGVSGSGKTSVLVHRAVRLAEKYSEKQILILTLNESLSRLISKLIELILETKGVKHLKERIKVSSFWEECRDLIIERTAEQKFTKRILSSVTDKTGETIDEIWEEFYCQKLNNPDAHVIFPTHQSLLSRNIYPQEYLRQEFDWIRSAFAKSEREQYLNIEREGRFIPFVEEDRRRILECLNFWEDKMKFVGAVDYLGLSNMLYNYIETIDPKYACILVDEVQDFGTLELKIVRKLVEPGENDLFLCGDIAQQVYNKQHKLRTAGITILPEGFLKVLKNYRNSREILEAAYVVFDKNVDKEKLNSEDFEVLNPEYANFSSPKPFLRVAQSVDEEFTSAYEYLKLTLDNFKKEKGCIAVCGMTAFDLVKVSEHYNIPLLSGNNDLNEGNIYLSDLEQTKGFEFDKVIVINCSSSIFPSKSLPKEEWHREISKLYVAMTRAKKELTISYTGQVSSAFENCGEFFTNDQWRDHIQLEETMKLNSKDASDKMQSEISLGLNGKEFLYTKEAKGISRELQNKLIDLVAGKTIFDNNGRKIGWPTVDKLKVDVASKKDIPTLNRLFGPVVFKELDDLLTTIN